MATGQQDKYIEMTVGDESYAVKILEIHEILKMQPITKIPHSRSYVRGVINLRGEVVPVFSLSNLIGLPEKPDTKATRIVVVNHKEESIGIIVDQVNKVTTFPDIQPPPEYVRGVSGAYFIGIGLRGEELIGILKLGEVLLHD